MSGPKMKTVFLWIGGAGWGDRRRGNKVGAEGH